MADLTDQQMYQALQDEMARLRNKIDQSFEAPSEIRWNPNSAYAKEMRRWNEPKRNGGMNRNGFEEFPVMLYKAKRGPTGQMLCVDWFQPTGDNGRDLQEYARVENFNKSNQLIAKDAYERDRAKANGWTDSPKDAIDAGFKAERDLAAMAGHRHYEDRNMSESAQREVDAAESAHEGHLAEVPVARRKPGRPKKTVQV